MADLSAPLAHNQLRLLNVMSDAFLKDNEWPTWDFVRRTLRREKLDATTLLKSLPKVGAQEGFGTTYGLAQHDRVHIADDSRPSLTVAAGLHLPNFATSVSRPFLLVLGVMVKMEQSAPLSPSTVTEVRVSPNSVRAALPSISDIFVGWLPDLLAHEPPTWGGGFSADPGAGGWTRGIRPEIADYEGIRDLGAYVSRVADWVDEVHRESFPAIAYAHLPQQTVGADPAPTPAPYVSEWLVNELEDRRDSTSWSLDKLIDLIRELNSNFAGENPYACHALLRSVLDHVPPLFGSGAFEQVASNRRWPSTNDKKYIGNLSRFKTQGHDVMHRQISREANLITMHDVPPPLWLNTLLREVIKELQEDKLTTSPGGENAEVSRSHEVKRGQSN